MNFVLAGLLSHPQLLCSSSFGSQAEPRPRVRTKLWDQVLSFPAETKVHRVLETSLPGCMFGRILRAVEIPGYFSLGKKVLEVKGRGWEENWFKRFLVMNPGGIRLFGLFWSSLICSSACTLCLGPSWEKGKAFGVFTCSVFTLTVFSSLNNPVEVGLSLLRKFFGEAKQQSRAWFKN